MNILQTIYNTIFNFLANLTIEQITLISIFVTLIIFLSGRKSEVKFKKLELRREEYKKFIHLLQKVYTNKIKPDEKTKNEFFESGASLLIYGSKKIYKKYVFFREYTTNPLIVNNKHNTKEIGLYIIADILQTIRHEVGMSRFGELESNEVLSFYVNDIGMNPLSKIQSYQAKYNIFIIKAELFAFNRCKFTFTKKIYYYFIKPVFGLLGLFLKYIFVIPLGRFLKILFPKWADQIEKENGNSSPH
ncbi:MAG TPA: hypothetical protein PK629_09095 [Oscillospiraceae bacterium]|nr:hypothetical protein [Oscillospiraceae bacterium]HPK35965.1 hypothetical protein [Oscillospiraceae bacterium]HPR76661.1 hypothetical protein [Oscillospiraceae bacterium]